MYEPSSSFDTRPLATIVVTFYNQQMWVDQALDSVAAQTAANVQLVITDDGSTDGTRDRVRAWLDAHRMTADLVFPDHNLGLPAILNRALPLIRGRFVAVLNGDDWLEPTRTADQVAALEAAQPEIGLVYSDLRVVDIDGVPTGEVFPPPSIPRDEGDVFVRLVSAPMIGMPCVMVRREVLDAIGPWDESLLADDFDFLLRVAAAGFHFRYLPVIILNYRQYGSSMTGAGGGRLAEARFRSLRKFLGRFPEADVAILTRMVGMVMSLHASGYDRGTTRRHLWFVLRRQPSLRVARAFTENVLHVRPGHLAPRFWTRQRRTRQG